MGCQLPHGLCRGRNLSAYRLCIGPRMLHQQCRHTINRQNILILRQRLPCHLGQRPIHQLTGIGAACNNQRHGLGHRLKGRKFKLHQPPHRSDGDRLQRYLGKYPQRPFRPRQQPCHINTAVLNRTVNRISTPISLRGRLSLPNKFFVWPQQFKTALDKPPPGRLDTVLRPHLIGKLAHRAISQHGSQFEHMPADIPVLQRMRPRRVIGHHAANHRPIAAGRVRPDFPPPFRQMPIQVIQYNPRLHPHP